MVQVSCPSQRPALSAAESKTLRRPGRVPRRRKAAARCRRGSWSVSPTDALLQCERAPGWSTPRAASPAPSCLLTTDGSARSSREAGTDTGTVSGRVVAVFQARGQHGPSPALQKSSPNPTPPGLGAVPLDLTFTNFLGHSGPQLPTPSTPALHGTKNRALLAGPRPLGADESRHLRTAHSGARLK